MKKIINYKKYDTETATEIGAWSQGIAGTFEYVHESLFRKNNGSISCMEKVVRHQSIRKR